MAKKKITPKKSAAGSKKPKKDNSFYVFATGLEGGGYRIESDLFQDVDIDLELDRNNIAHGMVLMRLTPVAEVVKEPQLKPIKDV